MNQNTKNQFSIIALSIILFSVVTISCSENREKVITKKDYDKLVSNFKSPADSVKPWCYWYWINDDISKEGVTKDLEAMKEVGIGAALIGNINPAGVDGKVPMLSEEWWETMVHAVTEGKRIGVDIGVFNCPGWSQSGGPWITSDMAMRYKVYSETSVKGGKKVSVQLPRPKDEFQDTYVLAFPASEGVFTTNNRNTKIESVPSIQSATTWLDGDIATAPQMPVSENSKYEISFKTDSVIEARNLKLTPAAIQFNCDCELEAKIDGNYESVKQFSFDRRKMEPNVGAFRQGPLSISFPTISSDNFRLTCQKFETYPFKGQPRPNEVAFSEISITTELVLDHYVEKQLAKMHPTPFPKWSSYMWDQQNNPEKKGMTLSVNQVLDISDKMDKKGILNWDSPDGNWIVQRFGMTPTGTKNSPSAPQGQGYEVDKMSAKLVSFHFDQFVGKLLERIPEESKSAFKYVIGDSYEMGSQNWSDEFQTSFEEKYGYDPKPFLPTYTGRVVESIEATERFLWDMRRHVADEVAYQYVGGLKKVSNENNLKMWLENYGHWGFPSEFLMYGGQSDLISGEFWNEGTLGDIECKASSSSAHIYGKPVTSAEAFTAAGKAYLRHPAMLRKRGDWSFTEGINHFVFHLYIHQPDDNRKPGVNAWFSTEFNRHNTWFKQSKAWVDYIRRCQVLLQQGKYVADVCYFIGENTPVMTGERNPELPKGYSYDYINAEVIINRLSVKNGRFVLPDGMSFGMMVLPPVNTMRPEVLAKIEQLVKAGGIIYGSKPEKSPSYSNFPEADIQLQDIADRMWGNSTSDGKINKKYGEGLIVDGIDFQEALNMVGISKDVELNSDTKVLFTHRELNGMDIYFLTNQTDKALDIKPTFRIDGAKPQLWDAVTGEIRALPEFESKDGKTTLPLHFEKDQSWFIVFANSNNDMDQSFNQNFPKLEILKTLDSSWTVNFENKDIGPKEPVEFGSLSDWSQHVNQSIKYYSGTATYKSSFTVNDLPEDGNFFIDLGQVNIMASVKLNGNEVGTTWVAPYRLNLGKALKLGENKIEIEVVNLWRNQMLKDRALPLEQRYTWHLIDDMKDDESLQVSGLLGPVNIEIVQ